MAEYAIPVSFELAGEWFLPDAADNKIPGTLSWSSDRARLRLNDSFKPLQGAVHAGDATEYPAAHGITVSSEHVTILNAISAGHKLNFGQAGLRQAEELRSSWLVMGAHVLPDTLYSEVRVRIPGLQIWISVSGIQQTLVDKTADHPSAVIYHIPGLAEETFDVPSIDATLGWGIDRKFSGDLITDISVRTAACLRVAPKEPQRLEWFFNQIGKVTTLLSFMAGSPMAPDRVNATVAADARDTQVLVALREAKYCEHNKGSDFFMLRSGMGIEFGVVFCKWFEAYDTIAMPSQLALSVLSSENLWLHVEFLSLMQALEGFHRATMLGLYTSEAEYEDIRQKLNNAIPASVESDHKDALKARIKYGNEISLRKRLAALLTRLELPLRKHILGGEGALPGPWVDTRNYYTHWDEGSRSAVLEGVEMHRASVRMRHLLRALYLDLVSIPQEAIRKSLLNASSESQYLIQLNNMELRRQNPDDDSGAIMRIDVKDAASPSDSAS